MARPAWAAQVEQLAEAVAIRHGVVFAGLEVLGEGRRTIVRVSVERPTAGPAGGVTVEECAEVAEELGRALDLHDPIPHAYTLEVASPGLDRPLLREDDYRRFAGRKVEVTLYQAVAGRRRWKGRLVGLDGAEVVLEADGTPLRLPLAGVARAHLVVEMDDLRDDFARGGQAEP